LKNDIRVFRAINKWSQDKLAEITGLARITISRIENESCDPDLITAAKISAAFDAPIEKVFPGIKEFIKQN
jgi:DNA-binding XRE family transcriptional regulator